MEKEEVYNDKPNITENGETINEQSDRGNTESLKYNEEADSFELDVEPEETDFLNEEAEYHHEDPYDSAAPKGKDSYSGWDEANPLVADEYDENKSLETDLDSLGMHVDEGNASNLSTADEEIAGTSEEDEGDIED